MLVEGVEDLVEHHRGRDRKADARLGSCPTSRRLQCRADRSHGSSPFGGEANACSTSGTRSCSSTGSAHGLETFHTLAGPDGFQNSVQLVQPAVGKQTLNGPAQHFICGIAVQPLCAAVPGQDDAVQILPMMASSDDSTMAARKCLWSPGPPGMASLMAGSLRRVPACGPHHRQPGPRLK